MYAVDNIFRKTIQTIPVPIEKPPVEKGDFANDEITPLELYKKEKFARLKEDYPVKPDHEASFVDQYKLPNDSRS